MMSPGALSIVILSLLASLVAAGYAISRGRRRSRMRAVPQVRLDGSLVEGQRVRVIGKITPVDAQTVQGPWSGTPCVAAVGETWETSAGGTRVRRLDRTVRHTPRSRSSG